MNVARMRQENKRSLVTATSLPALLEEEGPCQLPNQVVNVEMTGFSPMILAIGQGAHTQDKPISHRGKFGGVHIGADGHVSS